MLEKHSLAYERDHRARGITNNTEPVLAHFAGTVDEVSAELDRATNARVDVLDVHVKKPLRRQVVIRAASVANIPATAAPPCGGSML